MMLATEGQTIDGQITIISGGQTGADRAALDFAIRTGLPHGGWCPRGRKAEDGPLAAQYQLQESTSRRYDQRTRWNVRDSDATLLLTIDAQLTGGTGLTAQVAQRLEKPWLHLSREEHPHPQTAADAVREFLARHQVERLNIAGPRASQAPEIADYVDAVLACTCSKAEGIQEK